MSNKWSPWGTPEVTLILIDLTFLYETMCILIVKNDNDSIHDGNGFRISIIFSFVLVQCGLFYRILF